ncbi:MAG: hypothetical protein JXM70_22865 [Pirellulales bacterium]|nr:hypothetical protein [Pirellulales bacterium]
MMRAISVGLILLILAGCGGDSYQLAPVSGQVRLDGQPLGECQVRFQPLAISENKVNPGPGSFAVTDEQGRFTLKAINPTRPGAVVGKHRVWLNTSKPAGPMESESGRMTPEKVPAKYRNGQIEFDVLPEGTDQANFDLSSK